MLTHFQALTAARYKCTHTHTYIHTHAHTLVCRHAIMNACCYHMISILITHHFVIFFLPSFVWVFFLILFASVWCVFLFLVLIKHKHGIIKNMKLIVCLFFFSCTFLFFHNLFRFIEMLADWHGHSCHRPKKYNRTKKSLGPSDPMDARSWSSHWGVCWPQNALNISVCKWHFN